MDRSAQWRNTTHDWARDLDVDHLAQVRGEPRIFAPGGVLHLVLEVVAYAADEAGDTAGRCVIALHTDGSVSVSDDGRGTDTRLDDEGRPVKKPVMSTRDLRFFDFPGAQLLPDGHARRGMSVVAALSEWLVHINRRRNGSWAQRYEDGIPVTDLVPITDDGTSGTTVHFRPGEALRATSHLSAGDLSPLAAAWPQLVIDVNDKLT